ncbi:MAG: peptidylprolyl isomerase [Synechococcus sp. BS301-5m-G53]|uniref:peptidylprolyl isomerase n=1 Tax=unclassified Synechococcus TaxID=2626047 RepID=UPI00006B9FC8|nr:peptidylprolyl isomerase [Synechococcus sp. WH 7805]EAR17839.1 hypothetical protein WH7805_09924 [Synechococcus sp. WH 7805]MBL6742583.1 peptidylprolyl isomerase [Synechococcus sp. BS301-5m-G53]
MDNFKTEVEASLAVLGADSIELLRRCDLLKSLVQRLFIKEATKNINLPNELIMNCLKNHCQQEGLRDEKELKTWLEEHALSKEELLEQVSLPSKLSQLAIDWFDSQAETRFLERKESLDQATYSLLRVQDSGLAHELYLQLEAGEADFESLAKQYSEGPEKNNRGKVGPASLMRAHPALRNVLRTAKIGVVLEPIPIEQWWIVTRLEERQEANFDKTMRQRMATELLQNWMSIETNLILSSLNSRHNSEVATNP